MTAARAMKVAVLGAGLQGVCVALELATRGVHVDVFDRNSDLVTQAGARNEGKIHLGYVYAADRTLATAKTMIEGALAFAPALRRLVGAEIDAIAVSSAFTYLLHRSSMLSADEIRRHFKAVTSELGLRAGAGGGDYFGADLRAPHRELTARERGAAFDDEIETAFETRELSIDPLQLAEVLRRAVAANPRIHARLETRVVEAVPGSRGVEIRSIQTKAASAQPHAEQYDHAVNALWDGRAAIDNTANAPPDAPQLYRCKYALRLSTPEAVPSIPSATIMLGPFGDVVNFRNGDYYLSWYPTCLQGLSRDPSAATWNLDPDPHAAMQVAQTSFAALARLIPALASVPVEAVERATVLGGIIVARGESDIVDPASGLHRRSQIGIQTRGAYHSIDTGKYTMAPLFARQMAARICGSA